MRHILRENFHCLVAHCCLLLENKVIDFQSDPERSVSNHEGFYPHSSDEGDGMEWDMLIRKYYDVSVWSKCRNCSAMKGEKECLYSQEVEADHNFNLHGVFVLSQTIILFGITS